MRRLTRYGVIVAAGMIAAGCTAGSQSSSSSGSGSSNKAASNTSLTISNEAGQLWSCGFNPLNPTFTMLSYGFVYEPLVYVNPLQQGKTTPMLASSFQWSNGNKTLTFTIRSGVKWSDGTPMTANDVAYTFNLTKKNSALDLTGAWSVLSSVHRVGRHGHDELQQGGRAVLLLHRRPSADRARAHLLEDVQPRHRPGQGRRSAPARTR